jgi:hypothetical protein
MTRVKNVAMITMNRAQKYDYDRQIIQEIRLSGLEGLRVSVQVPLLDRETGAVCLLPVPFNRVAPRGHAHLPEAVHLLRFAGRFVRHCDSPFKEHFLLPYALASYEETEQSHSQMADNQSDQNDDPPTHPRPHWAMGIAGQEPVYCSYRRVGHLCHGGAGTAVSRCGQLPKDEPQASQQDERVQAAGEQQEGQGKDAVDLDHGSLTV